MKMSDVFELPLRLDQTWWGIYSGKKQVFKPNFNFDCFEHEANAAIHAINSHDQLQEENARMRELLHETNEHLDAMMDCHGDLSYMPHYEEVERFLAEIKGE